MSRPYLPLSRETLPVMTALLQQLAARGRVKFSGTGFPTPIVGDMQCTLNSMTHDIECAFAEGTVLIAPSTSRVRVYYSINGSVIEFEIRSESRQPIYRRFEPAG